MRQMQDQYGQWQPGQDGQQGQGDQQNQGDLLHCCLVVKLWVVS